jgi:WD40 repeat protein
MPYETAVAVLLAGRPPLPPSATAELIELSDGLPRSLRRANRLLADQPDPRAVAVALARDGAVAALAALLTPPGGEPLPARTGGVVPARARLVVDGVLPDPLAPALIRTLAAGTWTSALALSPDGRWLAAGTAGGEVRAWQIEDGSLRLRIAAGWPPAPRTATCEPGTR